MNSRFITILLFILVALVGWRAFTVAGIPTTSAEKTAFERITETRILRCAYASLPPFITIDANTGDVAGPFRPIMEEIAARLALKLEWTEEVSYGDISTGLNAGRYDAFCSVLWGTTIRANAILFTEPLYYVPVYACVRDGVTKYDNNIMALNSPDVTFSVYDNDVSSHLARTLFPLAKQLAVPPQASTAEWIEQVATGKADAIATCDRIFGDDYIRNNAGKVRIVEGAPLTHIRSVLGLPQGDFHLKAMIDQAIFEMVAEGTMDRHLREGLGHSFGAILPRRFEQN